MLLKNGKNANQTLLPLQKKVRKVLVAGTHADNLGYQCGGWTVEWQGVQGNDLIVGMSFMVPMESEQIFNEGFVFFFITFIAKIAL